jgi:protein-S-isoprenylcysteine O-methyltransferase Ste14
MMVIGSRVKATGFDRVVALRSDFYANTAQVLAIVLLALVWDSRYFDKLDQSRQNARFWKPRIVRIYSVPVAILVILALALCLAVLAGVFTNSTWTRVFVGVGLGFALGSLLFRIIVHILGKDTT